MALSLLKPLSALRLAHRCATLTPSCLGARRNTSSLRGATAASGRHSPAASALTSAAALEESAPLSHNSRLESLRLNAAFLAGAPLLDVTKDLPGSRSRPDAPLECPATPGRRGVTLADPEAAAVKVVEEPGLAPQEKRDPVTPGTCTPKYAHRMIRIRKRKMKTHRRRKRYKEQAAKRRRIFATRARNRECAFRTSLMDRVRAAKQFDAEAYMGAYLAELHEKKIPQTFKGKRHPTWLVEELMEKEKLDERRKREEGLDMLTREPLVREGETVEEFVKRMEERDRAR